MRAVWKFQLPYHDTSNPLEVSMPVGAEILHVAMQDDPPFGSRPFMWAVVDPLVVKEWRTFRLVVTGHSVVKDDATYVGTVIDGDFVWHFFEEN